jgi:hypothetical protein
LFYTRELTVKSTLKQQQPYTLTPEQQPYTFTQSSSSSHTCLLHSSSSSSSHLLYFENQQSLHMLRSRRIRSRSFHVLFSITLQDAIRYWGHHVFDIVYESPDKDGFSTSGSSRDYTGKWMDPRHEMIGIRNRRWGGLSTRIAGLGHP